MQLSPEQASGSVHSKQVEYKFKSKYLSSTSSTILLHQKFSGDLLGGCTWRGAALLARMLLCETAMEWIEVKHFMRQKKYLPVVFATKKNNNNNFEFPFSSCIELGSGAGLVSIAAAASTKFSSKIVVTEDDDQEILSLLEKNIRENVIGKQQQQYDVVVKEEKEAEENLPIVQKIWKAISPSSTTTQKLPFQMPIFPLRWGDMKVLNNNIQQNHLPPSQYFDLILCAEVLYDPELVEPFLATLLALSGSTHNPFTGFYPTIILTNDTRAGDAASIFFRKASKYFTIERFGFPMSISGVTTTALSTNSNTDLEIQKEILEEFAPDWSKKLKSNEEGIFILQRKPEIVDLRTQLAKFERKSFDEKMK